MAAQDDRLAAAGEEADDVLDLTAADGVEARGGFIEDDQLGVVDKGLGEADATGHALGELADGAVAGGAEADHFEELPGAFGAFVGMDAEEGAEEIKRLGGGQVAVEVGFLGKVADAAFGLDVAGGLAKDDELAARGVEQAEEELDGGGFAGAVGAEQAEDLAAGDREVYAVDGARFGAAPEVAEHLGEAAGLDDQVVRGGSHGVRWRRGSVGSDGGTERR
ncbi:MAG: hypothetical protein BWZ02_03186 [Lentisphaerae bacterium ADurb.BinA184]|nr:MAG: hypothetical protein BWZ02_03186 [Lentisphaerae bacterium ADurb.BinA184]